MDFKHSWAPTQECSFITFWKSPESERPLKFLCSRENSWDCLSAIAPTIRREDFSQMGQAEMVSRRKIKEELWVRRLNHLDSVTKWSEPRRAPPTKASWEPVSKARLATCPFMSPLTLCQLLGQKNWLGTAGLARTGIPLPLPLPLCRLTTYPSAKAALLPFLCVFCVLDLHPPATLWTRTRS